MFIEMRVSGLTMDPITNTPIVILKDLEEKKAIPIWIGIFEASAIATEIEKITFSRPMTHDLLNEIVKVLKTEVVRVEIHDLAQQHLFCQYPSAARREADRRRCPSRAMRLPSPCGPAHRFSWMNKVIEKSRNVDFGTKMTDLDRLKKEKLAEFLENLSPEDFGKYKM